ncbi:MAG: LytR/AlgR family response regulator transcription factor [Bacteroidia bacterium]
MNKLRVLIVEDEFLIAQDLSMRLEKMGYEIVELLDTASDAISFLQKHEVDICILDINIRGDRDGVELAHQINKTKRIPLIFLTSYNDELTMTRAKDARPSAYMLKPFNDIELHMAIDLAVNNFAAVQQDEPASEVLDEDSSSDNLMVLNESIFLKKKDRFQRVKFSDILWIEAQSNYSTVVTKEEKYVLAITLKIVEDRIKTDHFFRVSRSFVVNLQHVEAIEGNTLLVFGKQIAVSKNKKDSLFQRFNIL